MVLYHGTDLESAIDIEKNGVKLSKGRDFVDFGKGFYLTDNKGTAKHWATRNPFKRGAILRFSFDWSNLSVKIFRDADDDWGDEIFANRIAIREPRHDCIIGPIADGLMERLEKNIRSGKMSKEAFKAQIAPVINARQFTMKTDKALECIVYEGKEVL